MIYVRRMSVGNILDFEEEKAKKELNDKTPEELLAILLDDNQERLECS